MAICTETRFQYSRSIAILLIALIVSGTACTKSVKLSRPYDEEFVAGEGLAYVIETSGEQEYTTDRYAVTDSSVVIQTIIVSSHQKEIEPIEIPFSEIESLKRVEVSAFRTGLLIAGATAAFYALLYVVASSMAFPGS